MATKKKAAKPAKKPSAPKKAPKPAHKAAKPTAAKSVARKSSKPAKAAVKKTVKPVKAPVKKVAKPVHTAKPVKPVIPPKSVHKQDDKHAKKPVDQKQTAPAPVAKTERQDIVKKPQLLPAPPPKKTVIPTKPVKVVIPEMKTKTVRKYEPEFTKSVLDQPENIQTGPTMRYSDAELTEFRDLINKKLEQAKKELTYLQGLITRKDEMGGDENENRYMTMEDGSMSMEREQLAQMASRQINYIDHLEKAIMRIENKTYGICRVTGKLIDKARLRAVPHATLSIEAKQMMNK
jgi:RNA polymerase-binding transcription factor DksA